MTLETTIQSAADSLNEHAEFYREQGERIKTDLDNMIASVNAATGMNAVAYYVDQVTGSDSNSGSSSSPFKSINHAINSGIKYSKLKISMLSGYVVDQVVYFHEHPNVTLNLNGHTLKFINASVDEGGDIGISNESKVGYGWGQGLYSFQNINRLEVIASRSTILIPCCYAEIQQVTILISAVIGMFIIRPLLFLYLEGKHLDLLSDLQRLEILAHYLKSLTSKPARCQSRI